MKRKILLIEPNYKNKYPPMGLMKLSTYFKIVGDDVVFFKGEPSIFAANILYNDMLNKLPVEYSDLGLATYKSVIIDIIKRNIVPSKIKEKELDNIEIELLLQYQKKYRKKEYFTLAQFDQICITTLFTFYWKKTIDTINFYKQFTGSAKNIMIGGIASSLLPNEVYNETGIMPYVGLLDKAGVFDDNDIIIDELPLDYSILDEIEYQYPANNAYFAYMTRGCVNKCAFCAVPHLEPNYRGYIGLKQQIERTKSRFGEQRDLLLLDNNVLASDCFDKIIDEIKECGFQKGALFEEPNKYIIAIQNLKDDYNNKVYIKKLVAMFISAISQFESIDTELSAKLYNEMEALFCFDINTATKENLLKLHKVYGEKIATLHKTSRKMRIVDFNQGIDARLVTKEKMKKMAEINIRPLRIAFDHWSLHKTYEKAVRIAVKSGIKNLSNYLLYNFKDKPSDLFYRMQMNVNLCEELNASIYSFPMKYHPITDPDFFKNRNYIGKHWNRKFIRAIQAVLNSTKGKIGKGKAFFEEAFGRDVNEFEKILWMPETFIIYRRKFDADLRERIADKYKIKANEHSNLTNDWWDAFCSLNEDQLKVAKKIIALNKFKSGEYECNDNEIEHVISFYKITREEAENQS